MSQAPPIAGIERNGHERIRDLNRDNRRELVEDVEFRQAQVKKAGLGFDIPPGLFGLRGLQIVEKSEAA
jgi:hypothetical protein